MDSMEAEADRLVTFGNGWPQNTPVLPRDLARAGLYYLGLADRVKCAVCHGVLFNWEPGDIPIVEHRRHFPSCEFIRQFDADNIHEGYRQYTQPLVRGGRNGNNDPLYADMNARTRSFQNWPSGKSQRPEDLARAGFFYRGFGDTVRCFCCGVNLQFWNEDDNPWSAHARWSPQCDYLKSHYGKYTPDASVQGGLHIDQQIDGTPPVNCTDDAAFPQYTDIDHRLMSFLAMNLTAVQSDELAAAGYFCDSPGFTVRCFSCGMTLPPGNWENKNLFLIHDGESPHCSHIINLQNVSLALGVELDPHLRKDETQKVLHLVTQPFPHHVPKSERGTWLNQQSVPAEQIECKMCSSKPPGIVFLPCCHLVCCVDCSTLCRQCPVCPTKIMARVRVASE